LLRLVDVGRAASRWEIRAHANRVRQCLIVAGFGFSVGADGVTRVCDLRSGREICSPALLAGTRYLAASASGNALITSGDADRTALILNLSRVDAYSVLRASADQNPRELARWHALRGRWQRAVELLDAGLAAEAVPRLERARWLWQAERYEDAARDFAGVVETGSGDPATSQLAKLCEQACRRAAAGKAR
jgi:hypothetical protein